MGNWRQALHKAEVEGQKGFKFRPISGYGLYTGLLGLKLSVNAHLASGKERSPSPFRRYISGVGHDIFGSEVFLLSYLKFNHNQRDSDENRGVSPTVVLEGLRLVCPLRLAFSILRKIPRLLCA